MLYAVIGLNVLGFTVAAAIQSIVSNAADPTTQGRTAGAVGSLNSMMAVLAPAIGTPLLAVVSQFPRGDWRIGAPFYFCSLLQLAATLLAVRHFRRQRRSGALATAGATPST
jgi:DHA1 family tetracycline resistance protein-like MFS transporter